MYQNPVLFPAISNRETWIQIVRLRDGDTGDMIELEDDEGDPLYDVALEIIEAVPRGNISGYGYEGSCSPQISASLADYISIVETGVLQIQIPKSVMNSLRAKTYDVFLTITAVDEDDGRQLLIGRLPVLFGGRNT